MRPTFILLFLAVIFSNFKAQINASNFKVALDKENNQIHYSFNFEGTYFKVETTVYKNSVLSENIIAYNTREDDIEYQPIVYPPGYLFSTWSPNTTSSAYTPASTYYLVIKAWEVTGNPNYHTITLSYAMPDLNASNLKVTLNKSAKQINYSFNFEGTFFKVETKLYRNSATPSNLIAYGIKEDDSDFQPIVYPPGHVFTSFTNNQNDWAYETADQYIMVIKAYEVTGIPVFLTKTLTYSPPKPITPNLKVDGFIITEPANNNKIIFDSYNASQYQNAKFVQSTKNYNFKVFVRKEGAVAVNDINVDLMQYDAYWGIYPNTSPGAPINKKISFSATESLKSVEFFTNVYNFSSGTITYGAAFHIDRLNAINETTKSDNYQGIVTTAYPAGTNLKTAQSGEIAGFVTVEVLDENGKNLKTVSASADDKEYSEVKKQLAPGNYFFRVNNSTQRIKIYR